MKSTTRRLFKLHYFRFLLFLTAVIAVMLGFSLVSKQPTTAPVYAYKEATHRIFNRVAGELVEANDSDGLYAEIYHGPYLDQLEDGAENEDKQYAWVVPTVCDDGRFMRHFYKPGIAGANGLMPIEGNARCTDAVTWARSSANDPNSDDGDLTWTGAIEQYDYTDDSKLEAYVRVGHVAHLIGDMAQPEHVHLHPHPFQNYEPWARDNFPSHVPPVSSLTIRTANRMEDFLTQMAQYTYDASTFTGGTLAMSNPPIPATSEFGQMFFVEWSSGWFTIDQWNLYNYNATGGRGTHLGNWDGDYGLRVANSDDEWWETYHETMAGPRGEFTVEGDLFVTGIPAVYEGAANTQTLANIFIDKFPPRAIEYIAGLYQHFHEIVNHPPFVQKVTVTQAGVCMYDQHWEEEEDDDRLVSRELEDDCDTDEDERWINGEDGDVEIVIEFGPSSDPIKEQVQDVEVRVGDLVVEGSLDSENRIWTGTFTPPDDGSLDGEQTISITAIDNQNHFEGRNAAGDELDSDPASPAKAGSAEPYNWQGYEPGADENHVIKIEATPPEIEIKTETIGSRCEPKYRVSAEVTDPDTAEISGLVRVTSSGESRDPASGSTVTVRLGEVGVGGSLNYFVEAEDEAGNIGEDDGSVDGPPEPPGCDHSDDNYSAASPESNPQFQVGTAVPLNSEPTRVAVLANGFAPDSSGFVNALREPNILVPPDFSPDIVSEYPLLVIPTGGLYGLENSAFFRARLEEYANRGGTIIVFDQQHGADYGVLPGGGLDGYGWAEDNSCTLSSLYIRNYDQVLSGFSDAVLDSNVDGYFTDLPANSDILLHRSKNGQPAMVRYEFGAGTVIATTAYDDWGVTNWQTTADAFVLNRDLLAWAVDPALLPEYDPGAAISLSVPVTNDSSRGATAVILHLLAPGKQIISEQTQNVNVAAGTAVSLTFNTTANTPLGIWRVDYTLLGSDGRVVQARTPGERFIVKNPHPLSAPLKEVAFTVNAPTERFIAGSDGEFTFTVWNNSTVTRTLTVRYGLPHHTWETGQRDIYGNFSDLSRTLVLGPESQAQFVHIFPMRTNDRLFAYLYEGSTQRDATWFQTRKGTASVSTNVAVAQAEYMRGQTVDLTAVVTNRAALAANFRLDLQVTGPGNTLIYTETRPLPLTANGVLTENISFALPGDAANGLYRITANVMHGSARIGGNTRSFTLPDSPARFNTTQPPTLPAALPLQVTVNNPHSYLPVNGSLALTITDPDGITTTLAAQNYNLTAGQSAVLAFDVSALPAKFGVYAFTFYAQDQFSERQWTETRQAAAVPVVTLDQPSYRIRETAVLNLQLSNTGNYGITPQLTIVVPDLGFTQTQPVALNVGETAVLSYSLPLTDTLWAGFHEATATLSLGSDVSQNVRLFIPPARLQTALEDQIYAVGETIAVTLTNSGGVDAPITATLRLVDRYGLQITESQPMTTVLAGGTEFLTLTIPGGAVTGEYELRVEGRDTAVDTTFGLRRALVITGVSGFLTVHTDADHYFNDENITALATLIPTGVPISSGNLDLKICRPGPDPSIEPPPEEVPTAPQMNLIDLAYTPITGSPLTINVANDGSYQVIHNAVGDGQVYYSGWDIADSGIYLWYDGYVIGPDYNNHPNGSAARRVNPWDTSVQSPVYGGGVPGNPWVVTTDLTHEASGATLSVQTSYIDGADYFRMDWEICLPEPATVSTFLAADYYLQGSDSGYGYYDPETGSVGGYNAAQDWFQIFTPIRPASHYLEAGYSQIWSAIGSANAPGTGFYDTISPFLIDNGAGLQWDVAVNGCATVNAFWSFGETPTIPPVEPPYQNSCGYVLWETSVPVDTAVTLNITETVGTLDTTGRLILWGQASSETGQPFTQATYPFYVHDRNTGLTLETDQPAYQPGDIVQISGVVSNTSNLTQTLTLSVTAEYSFWYDQLILEPLTLAPGESYVYTATTTAYEDLGLTAAAANAQVQQYPLVAEPQIEAVLDAPYEAGRDPFAVGLTISNTGRVSVDLDAEIIGIVSRSLTLQPGESVRLEGSLSILTDTDVIAEISGDVNDTLITTVYFGEAAEFVWLTEATYPAGPVVAPYEVFNVGWLPVEFDTAVTLENSQGDTVANLTLPVVLDYGDVNGGSLLFDNLATDTYTLTAVTPFGESITSFAVTSPIDADLTAVTGAVDNGITPVTATVTNTGVVPFSGEVSLQTSFTTVAAPVTDLPVGSSTDVTLPVDTSALLAGDYPAVLSLTDQSGQPVADTAVTLTVAAADLTLISLPQNLTLPVSQTVTMTFGVANQGEAAGEAEMTFTFSDVADEVQLVWLPGGESGTAVFSFFVPPELEAKTYEARYTFNGEPGILELTVEGVDIAVTPSLDRNAYSEGDTAVLTLHITEEANRQTPPLFALVRFNEYSEIQPFNLTPSGSADVSFNVPVSFLGDDKVFFGIYDLASERSIHLNTVYLPQQFPDVTILTDKQVYVPGETVNATVVTTATGQLEITAPGYADTLTLSGVNTSFSFTLPDSMARGTYTIDATPRNCSCENEDQTLRTPFDVAAAEVRITHAYLNQASYQPAETIRLYLTVASDQSVTARFLTWVERPDGSLMSGPEQLVNLEATPANQLTAVMTLISDQTGMHRVLYRLVDPFDSSIVHGRGAETFDVGQVEVVAVRTDRATYESDADLVQATITLYAAASLSGNLVLTVDGAEVYNQSMTLVTGFQYVNVTLPGGYGRGDHILRAILSQNGLSSARETSFAYATNGPDLVGVIALQDAISNGQAQVQVTIANRGQETAVSSTAALYDGDPAAGGVLIGTVIVPALERGRTYAASVLWAADGQAGSNLLTLVADADADVDETDETNNVTEQTVGVSSLSYNLSSDQETYFRSDTAQFTTDLLNLSSSDTLANLTLETTVFRMNGTLTETVLFSDSRPLPDLAPGQSHQETLDWTIASTVADFDVTFQVVQQVLMSGTAVAGGNLDAAVVPVSVNITLMPAPDGHYPILNEIPTIYLGSSDSADILYQWDDESSPTLYTGPFSGREGAHTLTAYPQRNGVVIGPPAEQIISVDVQPPQTAVTLEPATPDGLNGWYVTSPTITMSATDDNFGVARIQYGPGNDVWYTYIEPFAPIRDDEYVVLYRAQDWVMNTEETQTFSFSLDMTPPALVHGGPYVIDEGQTVTVDASASSDATSGLDSLLWDLDNDGIFTDPDPSTLAFADGPFTQPIALTGTDLAGNNAVTQTTIVVNNVPPTVSAGPDVVIAAGEEVQLAPADFLDPGVLDVHTATIDWGDGTVEAGLVSEADGSGTVSGAHTFAAGGLYTVTVTVCDEADCQSDTFLVTVTADAGCALYPIALHNSTLVGLEPGDEINVWNGKGSGNFGWLTWTGDNGIPALVASLTPPGNSDTYINPNNPADHSLSVGDWVWARPGVGNSSQVRAALDLLIQEDAIILPVWDRISTNGSNGMYRITGYAVVHLVSYQLPGQNRIAAQYLGSAACGD